MASKVGPEDREAAARSGTIVASATLDSTDECQLGDFLLIDEIGRGGMGIVYRARQISLNRLVAVKVLAVHMAEQPEYVRRFRSEAQKSVVLNHPNVVQGIQAGEANGRHYFAMEFVDGEPSDRLMQRVGVLLAHKSPFLSPGDAVKIAIDVADALRAGASRGLVHRDIKPGNIMITRGGVVKVVDLGLAKLLDDTGITDENAGFGSVPYMAPEQARSAREVDDRADIFALGVTLYVYLTGEKPFASRVLEEVQLAKERGDFAPPSRLNPAVTESLDRIVFRMLNPHPALRPGAAEVVRLLQETQLANPRFSWLEGSTLSSEGRTAGASRISRQPAWIGGTAVALTLMAGMVAWWSMRDAQPLPADIRGQAMRDVSGGSLDRARKVLRQGLVSYPESPELVRPLKELEGGVLVLLQYQVGSAPSPLLPLWAARDLTLTQDDNYRFALATSRECFLYVFQIDQRPKITLLFPNAEYSPVQNPLRANQRYWIPTDPRSTEVVWMTLDEAVGEEKVYFIALTRPLRDIEDFAESLLRSAEETLRVLDRQPQAFLRGEQPGDVSCFSGNRSPVDVLAFGHR